MKSFFYSLTIKSVFGNTVGASCNLQPLSIYFSTMPKLERWRKANPDQEKTAVFAMHEISIEVAKELIKLSKKKPKCHECGR